MLVLTALLISNNAFAQWKLVNTESTVNFISIKKSKAGELHYFKKLNGTIDDRGNISMGIDLGSVDTNIPVRDDRMKSMLFEIKLFPTAKMKASVDPKKIKNMNAGDTYVDSINLDLSLHGVSQKLMTDVRIVKLSKNRLLATSVKPIIINADVYKLAGGIEKLRAVAKLPSISTSVPVTFNLIFSQ